MDNFPSYILVSEMFSLQLIRLCKTGVLNWKKINSKQIIIVIFVNVDTFSNASYMSKWNSGWFRVMIVELF